MDTFQPLSGVTVLDLSRLFPGPYGTRLLGDLGADVLKIEDPSVGDYLRQFESEGDVDGDEMSHYFMMLNRNKRSITLNLKESEGRDLFYELVADADVVVESFRPGVTERLGVDYETLIEHNPDLVYASLSGFGQTGPYRDVSGHDLNYIAVSGILGMNGEKGEDPVAPGTAISDLASGTFLALAVIAALVDDRPQYIDVSMTDIATEWTLPYIYHAFAGRQPPTRGETRHQKYPSYAIYRTSDDKHIAIGAAEPKFWKNCCTALGLEKHADAHHSSDEAVRQAVREDVQSVIETEPRAHWVEYLAEHDVPVSPVNELKEVPDDPHIEARGLVVETEGMGTQFRFPVLFDRPTDEFRAPPPEHGEQTEEVLKGLGIDAAERNELREDEIV